MIVSTLKVSMNFNIVFNDFVVSKLLEKSKRVNLSYLSSLTKHSIPLSVILLFFNYKLFK